MQELAESGARVLNAQAVEFARRAGIVLHARATRGGEGTVVGDVPAAPRVSGVTGGKNLILLRLRDAGRLEELLEFLAAAGAAGKAVLATRAAEFAALLLSLENIHSFTSLR